MIPSLLRPWLLLTSIFLAQAFVPSICSTQELPAGSATEDEARSAMLHGDYAGAEKLYRGAIEKNPASATLLTDLGVALQMQGRASEAIQVFERALKEKYLPQTYALLAEQRCISRDLDGARPMLSKIIRDYAGEAKLIAIVAPCYLDLDEPVESVSAYTVLLRDAAYPHDLALIRLAKSYLAAAQYFVRKLEERSDSNAYVTALSQAGASGDPRSAFPIAQRMSPNFHADLGFDEVLAIWHRHPDDPALLYQLAVISGERACGKSDFAARCIPTLPILLSSSLRCSLTGERKKMRPADSKGYSIRIQNCRTCATTLACSTENSVSGTRRLPSFAMSFPQIRTTSAQLHG